MAVPLWDVDLNLLVVLQVLLEERHVTRAAERLGRTQSAVSHALNRLRSLFDDELLVRDGRQMKPTARAQRLAESLPRVLGLLSRTLDPPEPFDPRTTRRTFRLAAPDFAAALLPPLLQRLGRSAPGARVELHPISGPILRDLAEGRYDALIALSSLQHEGVRSRPLHATPWRVHARADHPAFAGAWDATAWARWPHLRVRTRGDDGGPVDQAAHACGLRRQVGAVIPHFALAASILGQSDLLLTVPDLAAPRALEGLPLAHRPVPAPLALAPIELSLFRSATAGSEPGVRWFLDQIRGVVAAGDAL